MTRVGFEQQPYQSRGPSVWSTYLLAYVPITRFRLGRGSLCHFFILGRFSKQFSLVHSIICQNILVRD